MLKFSAADLEAIDRLWRSVPADHVWTGWSACGEAPAQVNLYRTRAHWRKFPLLKTHDGFSLFDDKGSKILEAPSLDDVLNAVEKIPGIADPLDP
ncbi:MAG: hypothetical protein AAFZ91_11765 [Pseudomonadota bacterium]